MNPKSVTSKPFMGGEEVAMIERYLSELGKVDVLEYGSGGSTVRFAPQAKRWYSIEHDADWAIKTRDALKAAGVTNAQVVTVPPSPPTKPMFAGVYTEAYTDAFAAYVGTANRENMPFQAALIDGRSRLACARMALELLQRGGYLFFHDFLGANRTRYRAFLRDCQMVDCIVRGQTLAVFQKQ